MPARRIRCLALTLLLAGACSSNSGQATDSKLVLGTEAPFQSTGLVGSADFSASPVAPRRRGPTPTRGPLSVLVPTHAPEHPLVTSTPDSRHSLPTPRQVTEQYIVQPGDTLGVIAQAFGIGVDALQLANGLTDQNALSIGQTLEVPPPIAGLPGPSFKIIPDSELVDGPAAATFDVDAYARSQGGYLEGYTQDVNGQTLSGAQIISLVAQNYSVNPRLLLALLEYRSHWVTILLPALGTLDYPLGLVEPNHVGLYRQLTWAANELNRGFYLWRANAVGHWVLHDGSIVPIDATINAGTAGVQAMLAALDDRPAWDTDANVFGLFQTFFFLFSNPFDAAIEPLIPINLAQPNLDLPFENGAAWAFTGGPHAAWDLGSAWGALDFAPSDVMQCAVSQQWVSAVASGFIVRAAEGAVIEDLDGDGYEQTGWNILYMHVAAQDRVQPGAYVNAGDHIGHPSCEGGVANAAHLHLARKYNGEWIAADGALPFLMDGWISAGNGTEYDGTLRRGSSELEASEGFSQLNEITR